MAQRLILAMVLAGVAFRGRESHPRERRSDGPPFPVSGPTTAAWREEALMRRKELEGLADWVRAHLVSTDRGAARLMNTVDEHLEVVRATAANDERDSNIKRFRRPKRFLSAIRGAGIERTLAHLDAVEADLIRLAPADYVNGQMPSLEAHINRSCPKRIRAESRYIESPGKWSEGLHWVPPIPVRSRQRIMQRVPSAAARCFAYGASATSSCAARSRYHRSSWASAFSGCMSRALSRCAFTLRKSTESCVPSTRCPTR